MAESKEEKFLQRIDFTGPNLAANWKKFRAQVKIYMIAKNYASMSEEVKIANTLLLMGPESVPIYEQFQFNEDEEDKKKI
jgi:hypothetical protein